MESVANIRWLFAAAGILLVIAAAIGGGVEIKGIAIPKLGAIGRILSGLFGSIFVIVAIFVYSETDTTVPIINTFDASPTTIREGDSSTLTWDVVDATSVTIEPEIGNAGLIGTRTVSPKETTTYTLAAQNSLESINAAITIEVVFMVELGEDTTNVPILPIFTWDAVVGAEEYEITLSENPAFTFVEWDARVENNTYESDTILKYSTLYYWRVRSIGRSGQPGPWITGMFTTQSSQ